MLDTTHIFSKRESWQFRMIEALQGNQSLPGCILIAVLQKSLRDDGQWRTPSFAHSAIVSQEGNIIAGYVDKDGKQCGLQRVCSFDEMMGHFRRYADTLKLKDEERFEMFGEVRRWIARDLRKKDDGATSIEQTLKGK